MSLNDSLGFIATHSLHKLHGVLSTTNSVMTILSFTLILEFIWICSFVLSDVLDIVILISARFFYDWNCKIGRYLLETLGIFVMDEYSGYAINALLFEK